MGGKRPLACAAVVATAVLAAAVPGAGREPERRCSPGDARTLRAGSEAQIYVHDDVVWGCVLATGRRTRLAEVDSLSMSPRAVALAGTRASWATVDCDLESCAGIIEATHPNFRPAATTDEELYAEIVPGSETGGGDVSRIRLRRSGGFAWSVCPGEEGPCRAGVGTVHVYKQDAGTNRTRRLDRGRDIDPASLRLRGSRLTWRSGSRTRSATLR